MKVVIAGDDYGLTPGVCKAINELLDDGAVTSASVMTCARDALATAAKYGVRQYVGKVGVHLQLTSGRPMTSAVEAPSLRDASGRFHPRPEISKVNPAEAELEWRRQVEATAQLLGGLPAHLDSHHGVHRLPHLLPVYARLAEHYGIPARGGDDHVNAVLTSRRVPATTLFVRGWSGQGGTLNQLKVKLLNLLRGAQESDVVEVTAHPGYSDESLRTRSSMNDAREDDLRQLRKLWADGWLEDNGFLPVPYSSIGRT